MKRGTWNIIDMLFLIFWTPAIILYLIIIFKALKINLNVTISELILPEEYRLFLNLKQREDKIRSQQRDVEIALKDNPFVIELPKVEVKTPNREIKKELKLTSILAHDKRACIINQNLYHEGDKIGDIKITKIGDYYVELLLPSKKKVFLEVGSTYTFVE